MIIEINKKILTDWVESREIHKLELDFKDELKMRHFRKIYPLFSKLENKEINEIELSIEISKALFLNLDWKTNLEEFDIFINDLNIEDFTKFSEAITKIMNVSDKKKEIQKL